MELNGKVKLVMDQMTFGSGFKKREFVITTQEQYPQEVVFQVVNERCALLDSFRTGDDVKVYFDIRGREYNGKYFVNLQAWKLEKSASLDQTPEPMPEDAVSDTATEEDDLPF